MEGSKECKTTKIGPSKCIGIIVRESASCQAVTNWAATRECLKKRGPCFICLGKNHLAKDCPLKIISFTCSWRHHVSLCKKESQERQPPTNQIHENATDSKRKEMPYNTRPYQLLQTSTSRPNTFNVGVQDSILLQTAQALIGNEGTSAMEQLTTRSICVKIMWKTCEKKQPCEINYVKATNKMNARFTCMWNFCQASEKFQQTFEIQASQFFLPTMWITVWKKSK